MNKSKIKFYVNAFGVSPVQKWIDSIKTIGNRVVLITAIEELLASQGRNLTNTPWLKSVGGGIYEFRVKVPNSLPSKYPWFFTDTEVVRLNKSLFRVFLYFSANNEILILHGYDKQIDNKKNYQQKQIQVAKKRLADYLRSKDA
jgi:putative component of toxin-antitoxin plasmid stabilization module